ncbi:MAG: GGDEF domain-containing protein [Eubacteriales bacterium]
MDNNNSFSNLEKEFLDILDRRNIDTKFQPIVDLQDGGILGFEAFVHGSKNSNFYKTKDLKRMANKLKKTWDLEVAFRTSAFGKAADKLNNKLLFLRVDPIISEDPDFHKGFTEMQIEILNIKKENIVFEITHKTIVEDYERFKRVHTHYKNQHYKTAVSKVGDSHLSLQGVNETKPSYVKIDKNMIADIHNDKHKQTVVKSFVAIARKNNFRIIAQGIGTKEELKTLLDIGVNYGQGSYFCIQKSTLEECCINLKHLVADVMVEIKNRDVFAKHSQTILSLVVSAPVINKDIICEDVKTYFEDNDCQTLAVLDGSKPIGLINRSSFDAKLSTRYGYSLYCKKPIADLIDDDNLIVDASTPIHNAGKMALNRKREYDDIMVLDKGKYIGIVTMRSIISYTIDYEKNIAKNLNPLTSLPGNTLISESLNGVINSPVNRGIFYADIDNFKVYNDIYGFEAGDSIISLVASILKKVVSFKYPKCSFVGHIGGDDFVFIVEADEKDYYLLCRQIISEFDEQIKYYFKMEDLKKGYFEAMDRVNNLKKFPLTSLTIAGVYGHLSRFQSEEALAKACAYIKGEAKKTKGSNILLSKIVSAEESRAKTS